MNRNAAFLSFRDFKWSYLIFAVIIFIFCPTVKAQSIDKAEVYASVDFTTRLRTWDGFGVNYVQTANTVDYQANPQDYGGFRFLTDKQKNEIVDLVFGNEGLQPSLVKMFLDPLHWREKEGVFDHRYTTENMRFFVKKGLEITQRRNEKISVITTLYGPPAWATMQKQLNGRDLDFSQKDRLANYLIDWLKFLKADNYPVTYISLFNEADKPHGWNKEGIEKPDRIFDYNCFWSPQQVVDFMILLRKGLDNNKLSDIGITPGECSSWQHFNHRLYDFTIGSNPEALNALSLITSHSFGGPDWAIPDGVRFLRTRKPELHAWVTSSSWGRNDMYMPEQIVLNINHVKVNAYIPWALVQTPTQWLDGVDPNPAPPIRVSENGTYEVTSVYYFYKQFTRAGKPGMAIVPVTTTATSSIDLVAFESNGTIYPNAFVVINTNDWSGKQIAIKLMGNKTSVFEAVRTYRKYGVKTMEEYTPIGEFRVENGYIVYDCPPHSVTTFFEK